MKIQKPTPKNETDQIQNSENQSSECSENFGKRKWRLRFPHHGDKSEYFISSKHAIARWLMIAQEEQDNLKQDYKKIKLEQHIPQLGWQERNAHFQ